jgi:hypothetical protein
VNGGDLFRRVSYCLWHIHYEQKQAESLLHITHLLKSAVSEQICLSDSPSIDQHITCTRSRILRRLLSFEEDLLIRRPCIIQRLNFPVG